MASPVLMPQAGQSMTEGKIVRWLVPEGTAVKRGDPILEIETDKANMEVEAPEDGVLRKQFRKEGEVVAVLTAVAVIAGPTEAFDLTALMASTGAAAAGAAPGVSGGAAAEPTPGPGAAPPAGPAAAPSASAGAARGRPAASPLARRLARSHGIDLGRLAGTGPRGRIIRRDVEAAMAGPRTAAPAARAAASRGRETAPADEYPPPSPRPPARVALAGMRKAIATALQKSKNSAPHFYATIEIDLTRALDLRREKVETERLEISVNDLVVRAAAMALADEPRVNCRVSDEAIEYPADVNIGIAVGLDEGLVVPVILGAQARSLSGIAAASRRIIELARGGKLVGAGQGTFTISNLGMYGIKCFTAVINPPEGAILAVGRAAERAVPSGRGFLPRMILEATLSADHRAIDGLLAARFLARLRRLLEEPERIS